MRKKSLAGLVFGALCVSSTAWAVTPDGHEIPYFATQYAAEVSDDARDADIGHGFQLHFGVPLEGWKNTALEVMYYDVGRGREIDGNQDYQTSLMLFLVRDLGTYGWGQDGNSTAAWAPRFKPFGMVGIGAVHEDVLGVRHTHAGLDIGAGFLVPLPYRGIAIRSEAHTQVHENSGKSVASKDALVDFRFTIGLQIPLMPFSSQTTAPAGKAAECNLAVVDIETGRKDCAADTDGDGIADGIDLCPGTPAGVIVDQNGCPSNQSYILKGVNFENDSAVLLLDGTKQILDEVAATLNAAGNETVKAEIIGHTDSNGSTAHNQKLSEARAQSVRQYLIGKGVSAERLTAYGKGDTQPIASNETAEGLARNRRVEFKIIR